MNALTQETSWTSKKSTAKPSKVVPSDKFGENEDNKDNKECNNECDEDKDQCNREEEVEFDSEDERDVSSVATVWLNPNWFWLFPVLTKPFAAIMNQTITSSLRNQNKPLLAVIDCL